MSVARFLLAGVVSAGFALAQNPTTPISVDVNGNRHAINPNIYGVAFADTTALADLNAPLNRQGGNNTSRYNWQINADNRDFDYYFESIGDPSAVAGERGDTFMSMTRAAGAQPMLTIPMTGWVAKLGANRSILASFSVAKYGPQTSVDPYLTDAGNGVSRATGQNITGNDPNDANVPVTSVYQQQWVQHLVNMWGSAQAGGLRYYLLDNEHSIWWSTHRDVLPTGITMAQLRDKIIDYAGKIRATDPTATILGPEEWGWSGYFYSGYDQQYGDQHGWNFLPDRAANGGADYLPWLLGQLKQTTKSTGIKYLDVFSVHYYPQGGEFGDDTSSATQLLRNRSTRSLWDPNYVDQSWINDKVQLIPRLKNWVAANYIAGTPVGITEYNWGAESYIGGATAQADIFGIFGREGLDLAARWTTPDPATPTYKAMKMYRNYDGAKSGFGDTSVQASVPNPDNIASFAAQRSTDGALTVMVISKYLSGNTPVTVNVSNFAGGAAQAWQLTSANAITRLADVPFSGGALSVTLPPLSVTLFVIPQQQGPTVDSVSPSSGAGVSQKFTFQYSSPSGYGYLNAVYGLVNGTLSGSGGCFFLYYAPGNTLYLYNDAGTGIAGTLTPGAASSINNSQCTVSGSGLTVSGSGNHLTVAVPMMFSSSFKGPKAVYGYAVDQSNANSGWQTPGSWTTGSVVNTPPTADSVSPSSGSGNSQTFTFKYSSVNGYSYLTALYGLFNNGLSGVNGCLVVYYAPASTLYLYNDAGTSIAGSLTPGAATTINNSQCAISGAAFTVSGSVNQLTLGVPITFSGGFTGSKTIYGYASDQANLNSGWATLGAWTTSSIMNTPPTADSVSPNAGSGASQTLTFKYSSVNTFSYLNVVYGVINSGLSGVNGCVFVYSIPGGTLYLYNDAGINIAGTLTRGVAGSINNSQCTIGPAAFTASGSGNQLTLTVPLTLSNTFAGAKVLYGYAVDQSNLNSGWKTLGSWTH